MALDRRMRKVFGKPNGFPKSVRLRKRSEFLKLSKCGAKTANRHFIAIHCPATHQWSRLGITVTKRVGRAAERNRIKRLIREYFRTHRRLLNGQRDINIIVKKSAISLKSNEIFDSLDNIFNKLSR